MVLTAVFATTGGRLGARRCLAWTALLVFGMGSLAGADQSTDAAPRVREERGVYVVAAEFSVAGPAATALATLTDYDNIPRFMPAMKTSTVVERGDYYAVVEQEAVATFMMFSKRIHLALEVREDAGTVRFIDRCAKSFERYEGAWTVSERGGRTMIGYQLTAKPSFEVPSFLLRRLLKRDALQMIGHLRTEIAARAARR
jgi:carbon monoxide dehydrogenase subunit G